jgi:hypothetical protein
MGHNRLLPMSRVLTLLLMGLAPAWLHAQTSQSGDPIRITGAAGAINLDGDLSDAGWERATRIETWYETNPGDNIAPAVKSVGYLTFDDHYFYAAFEFDDPDPHAIRSPYADHDHISGNTTDYGGIVLDTRNDGHSAVLLLATATGVQYDAVTDDDGSGEDSSPDFFWEAKARITERGWTLELRVPFSSLRYRSVDPQTWGILLYRNRPRDFRYQYFSAQLPRGGNCFVCRANTLLGLEQLPAGGHLIGAPYITAGANRRSSGLPGSGLDLQDLTSHIGADAKWTPNADNAIDVTVRPDFSQIESDTAQISANERFALSFPEKRPFFLEGVELFSTPFKAVYTRAITSPRWGGRATGKQGGISYTVLVAEDAGGGSTVIPGANGSTIVDQAAGSLVLVARVKRNFGRHFVSALVTEREGRDGSGFNRVAGPDFQWRPSGDDQVTGQWLFSSTRTPQRSDLSATWTGGMLSGHAAQIQWNHNSRHLDYYGGVKDLDDGFRADTGFIPQVGIRQQNAGGGWTVRPTGLLSRQRTFAEFERQVDRGGNLIERSLVVGSAMDTKLGGFLQFRYLDDRLRSGVQVFERRRFGYQAQFNPSRRLANVSVDGTLGDEIDFTDSRLGHGATINLSVQANPTDHLEIALLQNQRWVDLNGAAFSRERRARLFTAQVSRLRATYAFSARSFARVVTQYVSLDNDSALFLAAVDPRSGTWSSSALLAYKINWQSVLFVGYGDDRELSEQNRLEHTGRQIFVKLSYAFQR